MASASRWKSLRARSGTCRPGSSGPARGSSEVVGGEERGEAAVEAAADQLVEHRPLPLGAALLAQLVDGQHRDREERPQDLHVAPVRVEAGPDVREQQHELDVAAGHALLQRQPAQRRGQEVGLAAAGPAVEEEALGWPGRSGTCGRSPRGDLGREWLCDQTLKVSKLALATAAGMPTALKRAIRSSRWRQAQAWATAPRAGRHQDVAGPAAAGAGDLAGAAVGPGRAAEHLLDHVAGAAARGAGGAALCGFPASGGGVYTVPRRQSIPAARAASKRCVRRVSR